MKGAKKPKLIVIVGPTASGKSELAVKLAKKFEGEIISADSRQIYRGLDIGTGKVPGHWICSKSKHATYPRSRICCMFLYKGVSHHCIDFVSPQRIYTVAEFKKCAKAAIKDITSRGKIPIVAGGTGFWIEALVFDLKLPKVPPHPLLRRRLERKSVAELFKILQKLDPRRAQTIEFKNPRRLIRAIEIAQAIGVTPQIKRRKPYQLFWIGLRPVYGVWQRKIRQRIKEIIRKGILAETQKLLAKRVSHRRIREFGFEYRASLEYLENKINRPELSGRMVRDTLSYARRQMKWWKRNREIEWIQEAKKAEKAVKSFLKKTSLRPKRF